MDFVVLVEHSYYHIILEKLDFYLYLIFSTGKLILVNLEYTSGSHIMIDRNSTGNFASDSPQNYTGMYLFYFVFRFFIAHA